MPTKTGIKDTWSKRSRDAAGKVIKYGGTWLALMSFPLISKEYSYSGAVIVALNILYILVVGNRVLANVLSLAFTRRVVVLLVSFMNFIVFTLIGSGVEPRDPSFPVYVQQSFFFGLGGVILSLCVLFFGTIIRTMFVSPALWYYHIVKSVHTRVTKGR